MSETTTTGSSSTPIRSVGTTIKLGTATIGKLSSIGAVAPTADELDVTTLDTTGGYKSFLQGFKDGGSVECTGYMAYGNAGQVAVVTAFNSGTTQEVEIEYPDGTTVSFNGYVSGYSIGDASVDGAVGFSATIRVAGAVTVTAAT